MQNNLTQGANFISNNIQIVSSSKTDKIAVQEYPPIARDLAISVKLKKKNSPTVDFYKVKT